MTRAVEELRAGAVLTADRLAQVTAALAGRFAELERIWSARYGAPACAALPSGPFLWFRCGRFEVETISARGRLVGRLGSAPLAIRLQAVQALPELDRRLRAVNSLPPAPVHGT